MFYVAMFWAVSALLFWGWYFLSYYDVNFGSVYLSRQLHDLVFELYGGLLGVDPAAIPGLIADAFIIDTLLIGAIFAFRRRRAIAAWYEAQKERRALRQELQSPPAE